MKYQQYHRSSSQPKAPSSVYTLLQSVVFTLFISILYLPSFVRSSSAAGQETLIGLIGKDFIVLGADSSLSSSITLTSSNIDKIKLVSNPFPNIASNEKHHRINDYGGQQHIIAVAYAGESADCERLISNLSIHASQMEYESGIGCDVHHLFHNSRDKQIVSPMAGIDAEAVAHFARDQIAKSLRTKDRMSACVLIGGMVPSYGERSSSYEVASFTDRIQAQIQAATAPFVPSANAKGSTTEPESRKELKDELDGMKYEPKLFWLDEYGSLQNIKYASHGLGSNFVLSILDRNYQKDLSRDDAVQLIRDCFEQLRMRYVINSPEAPCIKCIDCNGCKQY
jgi:20S proteasome alpha/beta subunit